MQSNGVTMAGSVQHVTNWHSTMFSKYLLRHHSNYQKVPRKEGVSILIMLLTLARTKPPTVAIFQDWGNVSAWSGRERKTLHFSTHGSYKTIWGELWGAAKIKSRTLNGSIYGALSQFCTIFSCFHQREEGGQKSDARYAGLRFDWKVPKNTVLNWIT